VLFGVFLPVGALVLVGLIVTFCLPKNKQPNSVLPALTGMHKTIVPVKNSMQKPLE
jgi:hypothetical protein